VNDPQAKWQSVWDESAASSDDRMPEPRAAHPLRTLVRRYPLRSAAWVVVPSIGAATELSHRFPLLYAVLLGAAIGLAIGSAVLLGTARGWLPSAN
jgi:hypothetical protein